MEIVYKPYFDPDLESLIERIHPPRVCIDNDTDPDCTLLKVDSANKHGILLEMVQVLADLDLVISKSYISSDGGWCMDVFHVTDQLGNKLTDQSLLLYIQQTLCASRRGGITKEIQRNLKREVRQGNVATEQTALELTAVDRPGLLSEISAVLLELGCQVTAAMAWTHHNRAASIIYVEDGFNGGAISEPTWLAHVKVQLENVVDAHHGDGERRSVRVAQPAPAGWTPTERRLHQLMYHDRDYELCRGCDGGRCGSSWRGGCGRIHVTIDTCKEKGYSVVNVTSMDRPKLLFDTVCALTELQYVVFHAVVVSRGLMADQEYFIRQRNGCTLDTESQRQMLTQCLIAAVERRTSQGLRLEVCTQNRMGLLSNITRVFRENGLSISRAEISTQGERAEGSFYVTDMAGHDVDAKMVESVIREVGGSVLEISKTPSQSSLACGSSDVEHKGKFSLGNLFWSQLERLSSNFTTIKS